jgi:hypothetical protein
MRDSTRAVVQAVGAPVRITRETLAGRRRPIWWSCWGVVWALVLWDVYLSLDGTCGNTWSEVMRAASARNPVLPWIFGAFLVHLFHPRDGLEPVVDHDAARTVMVALTLGFVAIGVSGVQLTGWLMSAVACLGMVAGHFLWPKLRQGEWHW